MRDLLFMFSSFVAMAVMISFGLEGGLTYFFAGLLGVVAIFIMVLVWYASSSRPHKKVKA